MSLMFNSFNPFVINSTVCGVTENTATDLFTGNFEEVCEFMAKEYQTGKYNNITLAGPYADIVRDRVTTYSFMNYHNNNINFEVM